MKIALCTTTIHVPHALKLLRKCSADVKFFVAADRKTPVGAISLVRELGGWCDYGNLVHPDGTITQHWKCSEAIGWNTLSRRNIAFLEALKWGADVIVSHDDDNIPCAPDYFNRFAWAIQHPFYGIKVAGSEVGIGSHRAWLDPGFLLVPPTRHRGFPYNIPSLKHASPVTDAKVGIAAGLVIGNPDCDAVTRMEHRPDIGSVHILGSTGVVVDPDTWTIWNSQNTAVVRELIPCWFMMPGVGRHDDIYASLIVQRVARERGYHVHFGPPFTYQQRHEHNLVTDLRVEIDGMENVVKIADLLDRIALPGKTVIEDTRFIFERLRGAAWMPLHSASAGLAWLEDVESVL
jgi:hypothetical protein